MKPIPALLFALAFLSACHMSGTGGFTLTESSLYAADSVQMAVAGGDEKAALDQLQKAIDIYKKKGDTAGSVAFFKKSLFIKPTAKGYFELSGALLATKQYEEGVKALHMAEKLGYTPLANVMFRYAYAYEHLEDTGMNGEIKNVARYMELALQMGYAHPQQFLQKSLFPHLSGTYVINGLYTDALGGGTMANPERSLWDTYENQFPEVQLPLTIDNKWSQGHPPTDYISIQFEKFIPEMRAAKFSREGGSSYYYTAMLHKDGSFVAVVYCVRDDTEDQTGTPLYVLATYDPKGKIIDGMAVAGQSDATEGFGSFRIASNLAFQVQPYKNIYKQDPEKGGYDSTNVTGQEPQPATEYHITAAGKIEKAGSPLAMR